MRNCIDVDAVAKLAKSEALPGLLPDDMTEYLLFVGRLELRKGFDVAIQAFAGVAEDYPNLHLVLAGGAGDVAREPNPAAWVDSLPTSTKERIHFLGDVRGPELYSAMRGSVLVLAPSRWEAFGNVALEAKSAGAALIATRGSGFDDFCNDGVDSLLCAPGDPHELAEAIRRLVGDPALASKLAHEAEKSVRHFTARKVAADLRYEVLARVQAGGTSA
ncbi:glycosyltransferase family 4 protein [Demequina sp.]|uniref:glycosyltransferase family 4 protein n=1 Tax=Demequina sp. TaxID=2050685 RepID=UPI003D0CBDF9